MNYFSRTMFLLALAMCFSVPLFAQPRINIKEGTELQLGEVREGTVIQKKLTLQNLGTDTLIIEDVRTSCGCTVAKTHKTRLSGNESTALDVSLNTAKFKGTFKKEVIVASNDPSHPTVTIALRADIRHDIEFEPGFVNFHDVILGNKVTVSVTIKNTTKKTVTIHSVTSPDSQITLKLSTHKIPSQKTAILTTTLKPSKKGQVLGQFEMKTNLPDKPVINLSFIGNVQ
ncbi:MAG: DUF1573 domain-containing protein [Bacteroidetes bacterium]|nr:MAG: DUF1573 domain-containing protein [Bacteroidota bacterium]